MNRDDHRYKVENEYYSKHGDEAMDSQEIASSEFIYMVHANPCSESIQDRYFLQAYLSQGNGNAKIGAVLFVGTPDKCRELMQQLNNGEITQDEVKELFSKQQAQEQVQPEQKSVLPDPTISKKQLAKETRLLYGSEDAFGIYQLKHSAKTRDLYFEPYERLAVFGHTVDAANYELIYTASLVQGTSLEDIYIQFNINHPQDFRGHSLSVSDIIVIHKGRQNTAYYVDSFGYREVPEFLHQKQEKLNCRRVWDRCNEYCQRIAVREMMGIVPSFNLQEENR